MQILSPAFATSATIPIQHTGAGPNTSPPLRFTAIPIRAVSLVLIVEDKDATPEPWTHWLVFNIPPATTVVDEGSVPLGGTEGMANGGTHGYEGPNPIYFGGVHQYHFRLLALDTILNLSDTTSKKAVLAAANGHVLEEALLVGVAEGTAATIS